MVGVSCRHRAVRESPHPGPLPPSGARGKKAPGIERLAGRIDQAAPQPGPPLSSHGRARDVLRECKAGLRAKASPETSARPIFLCIYVGYPAHRPPPLGPPADHFAPDRRIRAVHGKFRFHGGCDIPARHGAEPEGEPAHPERGDDLLSAQLRSSSPRAAGWRIVSAPAMSSLPPSPSLRSVRSPPASPRTCRR